MSPLPAFLHSLALFPHAFRAPRACYALSVQYGDAAVRRAVPLALALIHVSDPAYSVVDSLSKLTHDSDVDTAMAAILGLGLVGAGTNNSRIAGVCLHARR